jgi:hypothetical protein
MGRGRVQDLTAVRLYALEPEADPASSNVDGANSLGFLILLKAVVAVVETVDAVLIGVAAGVPVVESANAAAALLQEERCRQPSKGSGGFERIDRFGHDRINERSTTSRRKCHLF